MLLNPYLTQFSKVLGNQGIGQKAIQENHAWISIGTYTYIKMLYRNAQRLYNRILMFRMIQKKKKYSRHLLEYL